MKENSRITAVSLTAIEIASVTINLVAIAMSEADMSCIIKFLSNEHVRVADILRA